MPVLGICCIFIILFYLWALPMNTPDVNLFLRPKKTLEFNNISSSLPILSFSLSRQYMVEIWLVHLVLRPITKYAILRFCYPDFDTFGSDIELHPQKGAIAHLGKELLVTLAYAGFFSTCRACGHWNFNSSRSSVMKPHYFKARIIRLHFLVVIIFNAKMNVLMWF